jgi:anti-sigma regulatory factor (Ser/Thr protein kinase)
MTELTDDTSGGTGGEAEQLQVAFPANPTFTRIGRVTVVGLALRLGLDVATVEELRGAVDEAVSALQGDGRISVRAAWTPDELTITFDNPDTAIADPEAVRATLADLAGTISVERHRIELALSTPEA